MAFAYDSVGNRRDQGGVYTTGNRINDFAGCSYQTDFDGNVEQRICGSQTATFAWSAEGRLTSFTVNGQTSTFDYNAAGRLIRTTTGGTVRHFLWERDNPLAELDGAGTGKLAEYSYYPGLDNPHALIVGTTKHFAHRDGLGNVVALTDEAAQVKRTYEYDAWGNVVGGVDGAGFGGIDRARFKGALWPGANLDLYYMRARWYEPKTGRFLSEDPIGLAGGINLYSFAANDPINGRDPTGLCGEGDELWVMWQDSDGDARLDHNERILGYFCVPRGGTAYTAQRGAAVSSVPPTACPAPPSAPGGADVNRNIRLVDSDPSIDPDVALMDMELRYGVWYNAVAPGGAWDYKLRDPYNTYGAFGNFNYGATGAALGYRSNILFRGAGAVQSWGRGGLLAVVWGQLTGFPYGDNVDDSGNVAAGIQYYRNQCHN